VATLLAALAADYYFLPPYRSFSVAASNDVLALGIFTGSGLFLSVLAERLRRARWAKAIAVAQEQQLEDLSRLNEELSQQSEELSQQSEELAQQNEELQTQSEEIQALNAELTRREDLLQKMLDAARLGAAEKAVTEQICAAALEMFGPAASAAIVWEVQGDRLAARGQAGLGPGGAKLPPRPLGRSFAEVVIAENKTAGLGDVSLRPDLTLVQPPGGEPFQAVLAAPLRTDGEPFGILGIYSRQKQQWTAEQFRLAEWLAAQCAHILETLGLQEELRRLYAEQQTIFNSVPAMIWYKDTRNNFVRVNRAVAAAVGKPLEAIEGKSAYEVFPDQAEQYYRDDLEVINSGRPKLGIVEEMGTAGGGKRWVRTDKIPYRDQGGEITGVLVLTVDITDRKRAEEGLAREQANLQAVFDVVNVGMLVVAEDGAVKQVNDTISRWVKKDVAAWEGGQPGDFVGCVHALAEPAGCGHGPQCASCPIRNTFASVLQTGQPVHDVEAEAVLSVDGSQVRLWLEVSADPLVLDGKRHVILAMNNITARKKAEETLRRTAAELARSNNDLEQFAYVASHDLREPLRTVSGFVQLLQKKYADQLDAEARAFIGYAVDGAARMETLIKDLLAYARLGTRGREPVPTDAGAALRQVLDNLHESIRETAAEITHGELPAVRADPSQLTQLFQNLIGNAIKFRGEAPPKIHVDASRDGDGWRFSVSDNGIGIEPKHQEQIFEVFRRLHRREQYEGTGIGLAICKKIVDRHGGRIWVESEPGQGATFSFTLPTS
jgi:PAS domain S-box-containing protein